MHHTFRWSLTALAAGALAAASLVAAAEPALATTPDLGQRIAVPAYIPPTDTASWSTLTATTPGMDFLVVNVANGPDTAVNTQWQPLIDQAHAAGTKVIGYVDSGYFGGSSPARETALGDTDATSWLAQAEQHVDRWYQFYGSSIDGIFVDDGMNVCGTTSAPNYYADLYQELGNYIKTVHPGALTAVNPGISVPECYASTADILVTFEGSATTYLDPPAEAATPQWELDADPNRFWHIVYDVSQSQIATVMAKSKENNAGYVYLTPDTLPNPYDTAPPSGTYWSSELTAAAATTISTPSAPARPSVDDSYSTGVDLSWTSSSSSRIVGYDVYRGATFVGSVDNAYPDDTEFTDDTLTPSTTYSYTVRARDLSDTQSADSTARSVTTDSAWGTAPSAPGDLTSSGLTANGVRLGWTASTVTDDPVAHYDVYRNGTRVVVLNGATTSLHLGELAPGTAYAFVVKARGSTGVVSAASGTVSVTTPNPAPIASPTVDFGATDTTLQAQYNLSYTFHHVYIDVDGLTSTGLQTGGIGADYMIENGTLYVDSDGSNAWNWSPVTLSSGPLVSSTEGLYIWQIPSSTWPATSTALQVVFAGSGGSTDATLAPVTAAKHT